MKQITKVQIYLVLVITLGIAFALESITRVEFLLALIYLEINRQQNKNE